LKDIALKTSGVYVPVGTRAYDLAELYAKYLQGRRGNVEPTSKRIRRADQFQLFLALAFLALLADALTRPYPRVRQSAAQVLEPGAGAGREPGQRARQPALPAATALILFAYLAGISRGDNPADAVREGLQWYRKGDFAKARDRFAAARE